MFNQRTSASITSRSNTNTIRDRLLLKFCSDVDLLALGQAISRVVALASSDDEGTSNLAYHVLSDVALTQKILRLANTVYYRTACNTPITTISKAIFLLGFDTIKASALALLLVDTLASRRHAQSVRVELAEALCASMVGRELARLSHYQGAEEAMIAALFKNLGRLLLASHEHALYAEVMALIDAGEHTASQAAVEVIGCTFDFLTESVLREWNIPDAYIHALSPLPPGMAKPSKNRQEWVRQVATFSPEAGKLILHVPNPAASPVAQALIARFGSALNLDQPKIQQLFGSVKLEIQELIDSLDLNRVLAGRQADPGLSVDGGASSPGLPLALKKAAMDPCVSAAVVTQRHPSGKPVNARDLLLAGVQQATRMMGSDNFKANDLIMLVMETLYRSMGLRFATICLRDAKCAHFRAVASIGENHAERRARFVFSAASERDVFHLAMENNADLMIVDANDGNIKDLLPPWHRALLPDVKSFFVLPLVVQNAQLGLVYGDRTQIAPEGIASDETALIRALMGQMLVALKNR